MPIPHPTGSQVFASTLDMLRRPTPWAVSDTQAGVIVDCYGHEVCVVDASASMGGEEADQLADWIVLAVNTCAGLKAELKTDA
jgi:GH24 family phage-related lysozyme (muramidase)